MPQRPQAMPRLRTALLLAALAGCATAARKPAPPLDPSYPGEANDLRRCEDGDDLARLSYADWPTPWLDACAHVGTTWLKAAEAGHEEALPKAEKALRKACPASAEAANGAVVPEACAALSGLYRRQGRLAEARAALEDFTCAAEPDRFPADCRWLADAYRADPGPDSAKRARTLYRRLCSVDPESCAAAAALGGEASVATPASATPAR